MGLTDLRHTLAVGEVGRREHLLSNQRLAEFWDEADSGARVGADGAESELGSG